MGRPPKYTNPEDMQKMIDEYFAVKCKDEIICDDDGNVLTDSKGKPAYKFNPPTISGLALYLGFHNRQGLNEYLDKGDFSITVKDAVAKIEEYAERQLFIGNSTGAIFWLKNKGWKDKTEVEQTNSVSININRPKGKDITN